MINIPYTDIPKDGININCQIYDKLSNKYIIDGHLSDTVFLSYVYFQDDYIGAINWTLFEPGIMTIAELNIFPYRGKKPLWAHILPMFYTPSNYRGRGLGNAMLEFIITSARNMGISEINGWMTSDDLKITPYLPKFYQKHGFTVNDNKLFYQVVNV